jgi:hypothetical protein
VFAGLLVLAPVAFAKAETETLARRLLNSEGRKT